MEHFPSGFSGKTGHFGPIYLPGRNRGCPLGQERQMHFSTASPHTVIFLAASHNVEISVAALDLQYRDTELLVFFYIEHFFSFYTCRGWPIPHDSVPLTFLTSFSLNQWRIISSFLYSHIAPYILRHIPCHIMLRRNICVILEFLTRLTSGRERLEILSKDFLSHSFYSSIIPSTPMKREATFNSYLKG